MRKILPGLLLLGLALSARAADNPEPAVEAFRKRLEKPDADRGQLRQDIAAYVRSKAGSPAGVQAAALLRLLPSPLDHLNPDNIPQLDRFPWQPKELVAVLGEHRGRQGAAVTTVVWTPNGKSIISGGGNGYVRAWDPATLRQQWRVSSGAPSCMAVAKDSKTLAVGSGGTVYVWDISGAQPVSTGTFGISTSGIHDIHISADGKHMAAGVYDGLVHTWLLNGSKATVRTQLSGHQSAVHAVRFSPAGTLTTADAKGEIRYWDVRGEGIKELGKTKATGGVGRMDYSPSGTTIAMTVGENIELWTPRAQARRAFIPKAHTGGITSVVWSEGGHLASSGGDGAKVWNLATLKPSTVIDAHFSSVAGIAWEPGRAPRQVATGSSDWTVRTWGLGAKGIEKFILRGHWIGAYSTVFEPDGTSLATGGPDRTARIWELSKAAPAQTAQFPSIPALYKGEANSLNTLAFTPDGKHLATAGAGNQVKLWDIVKRSPIRTYTAPTGHISSILFTPDGKELVGYYHTTAFSWSADSSKELMRVQMAEQSVNSVAISPDGKHLLAGSGHLVYEKGKPLLKDGKYVYADIALRLFDVKKGKNVQEYKDFETPVSAVSFLPDGRSSAVTVSGNPVEVWDAAPQGLKRLRVLKELSKFGHPSIFTADAKQAFTGAVVEMDTEKRLLTWLFEEQIYTYTFSPDGRYLAIALVTGPVYILRLEAPPASASGK